MPLDSLLATCLRAPEIAALRAQVEIPPIAVPAGVEAAGRVGRATLSLAMTMILFHDLVRRVPAAQAYIAEDVVAHGQRVVFDHGAIRTVLWPTGELPQGEAAFARLLEPLGYRLREVYPLPRLRMTGRSWCHVDAPEALAQFFVSELHPERFSPAFQDTVTRVLASSRDPLSARDLDDLAELRAEQSLPLAKALRLLPALVQCFDRQHGVFPLADYEALRAESPEMAWIATEGNAFNHATDRVADVDAVAAAQKRRGRPIKDSVEVSRSGRVRQTAFRAAEVAREFLDGASRISKDVPGSFYEFITRASLPDESDQPGARDASEAPDVQRAERAAARAPRLDLAFDAGNATGIFAMTAGADAATDAAAS